MTTLKKATKEKKLELEAKRLAKKEEPLLAKIFPISYAKIEDLHSKNEDFRDIFLILKEKDILLHHPYDLFSTSLKIEHRNWIKI